MTKLRVGLLFGGRSGEHEVSIKSARAIAKALSAEENASKYEILPFYIQKDGRWLAGEVPQKVLETGSPLLEAEQSTSEGNLTSNPQAQTLSKWESPSQVAQVDIWFPVLHGPTVKTGQFKGY